MIYLFVDASHRMPSPSPATRPLYRRSLGWWICGEGAQPLAEGNLLETTNDRSSNMAELRAVEYGMEQTATRFTGDLTVYSDNISVIAVLSGVSRRTKAIQVARCRELEKAFTQVTYSWLDRKSNSRAHNLANRAFAGQPRIPTPPKQRPLRVTIQDREMIKELSKLEERPPAWLRRLMELNRNHGRPRTGKPSR